ncbi:sensor histidine kinase [Paenibacillus sp. H1-7]|uniref:sensor histidine kinase n=1 Tax=Paenibacillus sp. H1-7 TaxID=2282849 RepID=UPI001EF8BB03|nr:HAMP domain-containing sensor histidine kinase [Paenibacillus sp. H1-7]ULL18323.1 sensor histidine kinase [Paenibacillus sp. H1-7]
MIRSIKAKFLVGFLIIFSVSLLLLNHFVVRIVESSNENIITQDLIALKKNSNVYVKQMFMINHYASDEIYFQQMSKELVDELRHVSSSHVSAYSVQGDKLQSSAGFPLSREGDEDLHNALNGQTSFTVQYSNRAAEVYYSYPVEIDGKKVGILRFVKDFSLLYEQSRHILDFIFYVTIAIFAAAFLFSYILSRNISIPIVQLTKASTDVTNGNLDTRIGIRRRDEIGKLAHNFNLMIEKINRQIRTIERDRDRLNELNLHRKQFYDNVTHELKTPLTSILGYAQLIKENGQSDEAFFRKGMNHIIEESDRLHGMVVKLLELSKEASMEEAPQLVEAGSLLHGVCEGMAFKAERYKKTIECSAGHDLWVYANSEKLKQLFINLIDNAVKYGAAHTVIAVSGIPAADGIRFTVTNQGDTIPPDQWSKLFEPFYRAGPRDEDESGSRGLGLSICKAIVDEHQGTISIESVNHETTVTIVLPHHENTGEPA